MPWSGILFAPSTRGMVTEEPVAPAEAAIYGLAAGCIATILLSALSRIPAVREHAEQVSLVRSAAEPDELDFSTPMSPATALIQASGPGPEGPAGLFAAKLASGLFGRDLAKRTPEWGRLVHVAYGSFWGLVYGILHFRQLRRPAIAGTSHGLAMWALGPGLLVPAMKLMPTPARASRAQTLIGIAGHLIYGVTIAYTFNRLARTRSAHEPIRA